MIIEFDNPKHEYLANNFTELQNKYNKKGLKNADEIAITLGVLLAADSLFCVPRRYRPHPLQGNYKGCFAVDVTDTHRIIFRPNHKDDVNFRIDNYKTITRVLILEIYTDYH